jgi:hypothetical protein
LLNADVQLLPGKSRIVSRKLASGTSEPTDASG